MEEKSYKEYLNHITTFIFDVDGVLTDGTVHVTASGDMLRAMNIKDGTLGSTFVSNDVTENILNSSMLNDQAMVQSRHLVAFGPAFSNGKFYLFDVNDNDDVRLEKKRGVDSGREVCYT